MKRGREAITWLLSRSLPILLVACQPDAPAARGAASTHATRGHGRETPASETRENTAPPRNSAPDSPPNAVPHEELHANRWCETCDAGFLAGVRVPSRALFETLDAHGHDVVLARLDCDSCQAAARRDGFCEICRMGFVAGQAYLSRLAHVVARGRPHRTPGPRGGDGEPCALCETGGDPPSWCERCERAVIGGFETSCRDDLPIAIAELARLRDAVELVARCETCALARLTGGRCRSHPSP